MTARSTPWPLGPPTTVSQDAKSGGTLQPRGFTFDALGRMLTETAPEAGTTAFTYGSASACGTASYLGGLVEKLDNMGNVTCLAYDPLGRVTAITYPSGPHASVTPPKTFIYDTATVDGQNMANAMGRLAEAYTGASGAKITDEGFEYDSMGRPAEFFESTPNSGGYYETQESYWYDGQPDTLSLPWTPMLTCTPNALGEVTSVSAASGQNPVTNAAYNAAGQLTAVTFGSGDSDAYQYSAATGRMSQYQFTVNGQTDTGTLGWNADGTLASLDIADNISGSGDTQNCTYAHDDLGRLSGVTCGSLWQQTFSLDAFGNLKTSGNVSWQPTYSAATNQANISYDGDGNVTNDGLNTYAWGAPYYYAPDGRIAGRDNACCGIRDQFAWLPGGAEVDYDCCNVYYYHHGDWLGSWRLGSEANQTLWSAQAIAPFGDAYAHGGPAVDWSLTGKTAPLATSGGTGIVFSFPFRDYQPTQGRWLSPDPAGLAAVNPANPQTWNAYAYVGNQPLAFTDPLGLFEAPCDVFGDPCGGGPGPCDPNDIGWDPWPAPGCGGGGGWGFPVYPILPSGGGGGGSPVLGGTGASAPGGPCTAGVCSPSSLIAPGGGADAGVFDDVAAVFSVTVEACALNPECIAALIALGPEVAVPVIGATLIYEGVKLGIGIYQARTGANQRENAQAAAALQAIQRICGGALPPNAKERLHRLITGRNLSFGQIVQAGVELFCPEKAGAR